MVPHLFNAATLKAGAEPLANHSYRSSFFTDFVICRVVTALFCGGVFLAFFRIARVETVTESVAIGVGAGRKSEKVSESSKQRRNGDVIEVGQETA